MNFDISEIIFIITIGWTSGVLVNYLADVLPWKRRLVRPYCVKCDEAYCLLNYIVWPRKCAMCGSKRGWGTWIVEIVYIGMALWSWNNPLSDIGFWGGWSVLVYFGVVVVIDIEHRLIMHPVSLAGGVLGLVIGLIRNGWWGTLLGGAAGFGSMWLLFLLGEGIIRGMARLRGQSVNEVALGFGDVNLSGILGFILGWPLILPGLLLAILVGGFVSLIYLLVMLILRRYRSFLVLPYGPFLIFAAVTLIFFRDNLIHLLAN